MNNTSHSLSDIEFALASLVLSGFRQLSKRRTVGLGFGFSVQRLERGHQIAMRESDFLSFGLKLVLRHSTPWRSA